MRNERLKVFLGGIGCALVVGALLVVGAFFVFPILGGQVIQVHGFANTQNSVSPFDASTPLATPSLIPNQLPAAPVSTPILNHGAVVPGAELDLIR